MAVIKHGHKTGDCGMSNIPLYQVNKRKSISHHHSSFHGERCLERKIKTKKKQKHKTYIAKGDIPRAPSDVTLRKK